MNGANSGRAATLTAMSTWRTAGTTASMMSGPGPTMK